MKLIVKNLKKSFEEKEVLKDINFEFEKGKIYGLLGRNGAGKTTFFNCLNEDIDIDTGEFYIEDNNVKRKMEAEDIGYEPRDGLFVHFNEQKVRPLVQKVRPLVHVPWFKRIVKNSSANNGLFSRYMLFY